jgi:hypothetical protein
MTPTEKAIRDFCGHHADWWPSTTQVQEMLALAQPAPVQEPAEKFCDANCTWSDHHPDCKLAKREFVGLTDEEIWDAYMKAPLALDCSTDELYALSRTIEAKLKEKNT